MCRVKLENMDHQVINLDFNDITELADFMDAMEPVMNLEDIEVIDLTDDSCTCDWFANYMNN